MNKMYVLYGGKRMKPEDTVTIGNVNEPTENSNMQISDDEMDQVSGGAKNNSARVHNPFNPERTFLPKHSPSNNSPSYYELE